MPKLHASFFLCEENIAAYKEVPAWLPADFVISIASDTMTQARISYGNTVLIDAKAKFEDSIIAAVRIGKQKIEKPHRCL